MNPTTRIRRLLELIRFSHTVFALPFALLAAILAWRETPFRWQDLTGILLSMVFARAVAMAFNRLVDQRWDAENPRTAGRHLPAGLLSRATVAAFALVCTAGFIGSTLLFLPNIWPLMLAAPVLVAAGSASNRTMVCPAATVAKASSTVNRPTTVARFRPRGDL